MQEIATWLGGVEKTAAELYSEAARRFADDPPLARFLKDLADEEREHYRLVATAGERLAGEEPAAAPFTIDDAVRAAVEEPFVAARSRLAAGTLSRKDLAETIAVTEFSEWNEIFLYVIDTLKGQGATFQKAAAEIEHHRAEIIAFLGTLPGCEECLEQVRGLQPLWKKRVLVVEDDSAVANLLQHLLAAEGEVVLAVDGTEGLARLEQGHFDVIVSDIEMPGMSGIELYRRALKLDPNIARRFVFFSGSRKPEHEEFLRGADIISLRKPSPLSQIRQTIAKVVCQALSTH